MRFPTVIPIALSSVFALGACASNKAVPTADAKLAEELAAAELAEYHRQHHRGGATQFIAMSLDTLGEDDAKRPQVEKLQNDLYGCLAPAGEIENRLTLAIADGIATGPMDKALIKSTIDQLDTTAATVHTCRTDALNQLHALLSPIEREALVEKILAHWEVWYQVNSDVEGNGNNQHGRISELARDLALTPKEVSKISTAVHTAMIDMPGKFDHEKAQARMQMLTNYFVDKSFDAKAITANADEHLATFGAMRKARFYETVAPLLTPAQRVKLASQLREDASSHLPTIATK